VIETLRLVEIRCGYDHTHPWPPCANLLDQVPELTPGERIDPGSGLIENQQVRIVDECKPSFCFIPPDRWPAGRS
jgi:hypothetical protein